MGAAYLHGPSAARDRLFGAHDTRVLHLGPPTRSLELSATSGEVGISADAGSQLASRIAYHDLIERAPEWPFDAPMSARLALFAALGLGSWLGGAAVERLLETWF